MTCRREKDATTNSGMFLTHTEKKEVKDRITPKQGMAVAKVAQRKQTTPRYRAVARVARGSKRRRGGFWGFDAWRTAVLDTSKKQMVGGGPKYMAVARVARGSKLRRGGF